MNHNDDLPICDNCENDAAVICHGCDMYLCRPCAERHGGHRILALGAE